MATWQHLRSSTANKRPTTSLADGRIAINTNTASPGLFFKDSAGTGIVKVGPVHVGTTAPNSVPASGGSSGNYLGEQWLDTSVSPAQMKVWNGSTWVGVVADELPVSKLQDGAARQLIQTDAAGTGVEWTSNVDVPGTLDVTSTATFDSIAQHPLGSAAAPTLTFTGDNNTGIYSPGADQVAISTGGSGRLFVNASGNVAIRKVVYNSLLDIHATDNVATNYPLRIDNNADTYGAGYGAYGFSNRVNLTNTSVNYTFDIGGAAVFNTQNQERLRITSTGALNFTGAGTAGVTQAVSFNGSAPVDSLVIDSNGFTRYTGSIGRGAPVTKTGAFTVGIAENWLICNGTASITVTLPTASAWTGREIMLKTIAAFTVVSASSNVVPLAGGAAGTAILAATAGRFVTLVSDGTNWIIMQAN